MTIPHVARMVCQRLGPLLERTAIKDERIRQLWFGELCETIAMLDHLDTSELTPDEIATIQFARELLAANPRIGKDSRSASNGRNRRRTAKT